MAIAIVNYGMGNLGSVEAAVKLLGVGCFISSEPQELADAEAFIMPGVGAFGQAMENLRAGKLDVLLHEQVIEQGKPLLGICLGMQLLATDSVEFSYTRGLGWIPGHVVAIQPNTMLPVPHVGWNQVVTSQPSCLFNNIEEGSHFYFDHSLYYDCAEPTAILATCEYGSPRVAALRMGNIFATQFHPEKSQRNGLKLLRNFFNYVDSRC